MGRGIFGNNKTFEGLLFGINIGLILALIFNIDFLIGLIITVSTQTGDLLGSFIKRRFNIRSGDKLPVTDQLGFITTVFFFLSFITDINFFIALVIILLTYPAHRCANMIALKLGLKNVAY